MKTAFMILVLLGVAGGGAAYYAKHKAVADPATSFRTVAIKRGDLLSTISATGTIEPEEVVNVGAQVCGLIVEFGDDPHDPAKLIDYGTVVEKDDRSGQNRSHFLRSGGGAGRGDIAEHRRPICCNLRQSSETGGARVEAGQSLCCRHKGNRRHRL